MSAEDDRDQPEVVGEPSETLTLDASNFVADCKQTLLGNLDKHTSRLSCRNGQEMVVRAESPIGYSFQ